jgi:membrane-associated PAP2 superfamily phosphatase
MTNTKQVQFSLVGLAASLIWFELTPTDLWFQQYFFDASNQQWILDRTEPVMRFLLYDGIKALLVLLMLSLVACLVFFKCSSIVRQYSKGIRIVVFSLILVPGVVGSLKATTNVACPRVLSDFGGALPHVGLLGQHPKHQQRCFPAGHASGGFALMSFFLFFKTAKNRKRALYISLSCGWIMGGYKMLIGDHFLSHTIVTMLLAWLIINAIAMLENYLFPPARLSIEASE